MRKETPDEWYEKHGKEPPQRVSHGLTDDQIKDNLVRYKATSWRLEGNQLIAESEMGRLVQRIPTDYICEGMDDKGLPKLRKVVLSK